MLLFFENGYPTTEELVCSAVSKARVCNSCAICTSYAISHGTTLQSKIVCEMHVAQLLQTLSLLTAEHTKLLCCEVAIFKTSGI
jgi:hypothetical protein